MLTYRRSNHLTTYQRAAAVQPMLTAGRHDRMLVWMSWRDKQQQHSSL
jgi:hypothetical protein